MKRYPETILATCVVPWDADYNFDEALFRDEIRRLSALTNHVYIFGTAGEGYAVNEQQFDQITTVFWDETQANNMQTMVGVISLSLSTIISRIERACERGFDTFQLSLPSWGELSDREIELFFDETCGRFPSCRFLHYNLSRSRRLLTGDDYGRLSAKHENLVAVKNGAGTREELVVMLTKAPEVQFFFTERAFSKVRDEYECGLLISLAVTNVARAQEFVKARGESLQAFMAELELQLEALFDSVGNRTLIDGAYDKLLYKLHQPKFPLRLLPPYIGAEEASYERMLAAMPVMWRPDQ